MTMKVYGPQSPSAATEEYSYGQAAVVKITSFSARQKANAFVKMEITSQMGSGEPALILTERPRWSVPVYLCFPDRGMVGKVGDILVDAMTGEVMGNEETVRKMTEDATCLAERTLRQA